MTDTSCLWSLISICPALHTSALAAAIWSWLGTSQSDRNQPQVITKNPQHNEKYPDTDLPIRLKALKTTRCRSCCRENTVLREQRDGYEVHWRGLTLGVEEPELVSLNGRGLGFAQR